MSDLSAAIEIVKARRAIYVEKQKRRNALEDDTCNEWERIGHTIKAMDYLLAELGESVPDDD